MLPDSLRRLRFGAVYINMGAPSSSPSFQNTFATMESIAHAKMAAIETYQRAPYSKALMVDRVNEHNAAHNRRVMLAARHLNRDGAFFWATDGMKKLKETATINMAVVAKIPYPIKKYASP